MVALGICSGLSAQEPVPDFRTDGFSPPVHIPPRVTRFDPGLPESLNGKFNSTQTIRSNNRSGLRAVISDLTTPNQSNGHSTRTRTRQNTSFQGTTTETSFVNAPSRRNGIQDRISQMMVSDSRVHQQRAVPEFHQQSVVPQQVAVPQRRPAPATAPVPSYRFTTPPRQVAPNTHQLTNNNIQLAQASPQPQRSRVHPPQVQPAGRNSMHPPRGSITTQSVLQRTSYPRAANNRLPEKPVARRAVDRRQAQLPRQNAVAQPQNIQRAPNRGPVRQVALQQSDRQSNSFVSRAQGQFTPPPTGQLSSQRPRQFTPPLTDPFSPQRPRQFNPPVARKSPRAASPRDAAIEFRQSRRAEPKAQSQQLDGYSEPVSVLSTRSEDELSLDPVEESGSDFGPLDVSPESTIESYESFARPTSSGSVNTLRSYNGNNSAAQLDEEDEDLLDSDLEGSDDADFEDDSQNPITKTCEEFRTQLLNEPITNIALDISPPGKVELFGANVFRVWRDQYGNELAQGTIADLRRGYVIINSSAGGQVRLPYARLGDSDWLAISDYWRLPIECGLGAGRRLDRNWVPQSATWYASSLCHKPLFFENRQLERYGHSHGPFLQPAESALHFFGSLFFLPYHTAINPPNECQYALGFYRPGNCAPWLKDPFPISLSGAIRQTGIFTGIGFLAN